MKRIVSLFLCALLLVCSVPLVAFAGGASCGGKCENSPTIVIPGLFQSEVKCYDEDGNVMLDSDGNERKGPFFMDTSEVVESALKKALIPLSKTLITQYDAQHEFANALGDVLGEALMEMVKSDSNGNFVHDIRATEYNTSLANLSAHDRNYALSAIPLNSYVSKVGADHLYFFSYSSFDNMEKLAKQLYELIQTAKEETGHSKVNVAPISQGGSIWNAIMEYYPEVANDVDRVVYIVPAVDGSALIGDIFENGFIDDDDALYDYMFPKLLGEEGWVGYLVDLLIRVFPKDVLNDVLDIAVDKLINEYISYSTAIWGLIPSGSYPTAREKHLQGEEKAVIRAQADRFYNAQLNAKKNILAFRQKGVQFFDIVGYNHSLYPIVDSWNKVNADGIIQLSSTSLGAVSAPVNGSLGSDYVQKGNSYATCTDPIHKHIDPHNMVDASTALLPDHTFYFYGLNHERTADCDVIIKLAVRLLWDNSFTSVYSYPNEFPQFNSARRVSKSLTATMNTMRNFDTSSLSQEDAQELSASLALLDSLLEETIVDAEAFEAAEARFNAIAEKITAEPKTEEEEKKESFLSLLQNFFAKLLKFLNDALNKFFGYRGFSKWHLVPQDETTTVLNVNN